MNNNPTVLSLFDGISCAQVALDRIGKTPARVYASEIDKHAIKVTQANWPATVQLGSITGWKSWDIPWQEIDIIVGGFPCQSFSFAGDQKALLDPRGQLFLVLMDILAHAKQINPSVKYLFENVRMNKSNLEALNRYIGHGPVQINSALVSAQNRERYYWCNWNVETPADKGILLKDILETDVPEKYFHSEKAIAYMNRGNEKWGQAGTRRADGYTQRASDPKSFTLTANMHKGVPYNYFEHDVTIRPKSKTLRVGGRNSYDRHEWDSVSDCHYRKLTPVECERLQTLPDGYTAAISDTQRYKALGNSFTVDVIAHIFSELYKNKDVACNNMN